MTESVCSGNPVLLKGLVEQLIADHGLSIIRPEYGSFPDMPYDSPASWGDYSKIRALLENRNAERVNWLFAHEQNL